MSISVTRRTRALACLIACLLLAASSSASAVGKTKKMPGRGTEPAFVCVSATIDEKGHAWLPTITRPSGSLKADRNALKLVRMLKYREPPAQRTDAQLLIKFYGNGNFAFHTFWPGGEPVHEICSTPVGEA